MIKLMQGDCLEKMSAIADKSVDMILTDLPYGMTECKWDEIIDFPSLWKQYERILKERGVIVLFAAQPFATKLINSKLRLYKYSWYWIKNIATNFAAAHYQPLRCVEEICVFYKKAPTYNPQGLLKLDKPKIIKPKFNNIYKKMGYGESFYTNYPKDTLYFDKERGLHPSQKPIPLLEYLIKTYTNENEVVLDSCMGSGSTGIACVNTGRRFIGIEKDEKYFKLAQKRIDDCQKNKGGQCND